MNIEELHSKGKPVSASSLFKSDAGNATALQIMLGQTLKEHITQTPALLVCVSGEVVFENENGYKEVLISGDYVLIEPMVKHWVLGIANSQLVLFK